jgi:hypothetical protein
MPAGGMREIPCRAGNIREKISAKCTTGKFINSLKIILLLPEGEWQGKWIECGVPLHGSERLSISNRIIPCKYAI